MTLKQIQLLIKNQNAWDLFGSDIDSRLKELLVGCHPDRFEDEKDKELALSLSKQLSLLAEKAREPRLSILDYLFVKDICTGDSSYVRLFEKAGKKYIFKSPLSDGVKKLVGTEFNLTKDLVSKSTGQVFEKFFRKPVEIIIDAKNKDYHCVYEYTDGLISVADLINMFPSGLDGRHIVWITRRVLAALAYLHSQDICHNAPTPDHLLVEYKGHGLVLAGLLHSTKTGEKPPVIPAKYTDIYPDKWVKDIKKASSGLDIYLAISSMLKLAGINCHTRIKNFLKGVQLESLTNPQSGIIIHDELGDLAKSLYGKPKFFELELINET
jgi:hypothetical protein